MFTSFIFVALFGSADDALAFSRVCFQMAEPAFSHGFNYPNGRTQAIQEFCRNDVVEDAEYEAHDYSKFAQKVMSQWPKVLKFDERLASIAARTLQVFRTLRTSRIVCAHSPYTDPRCMQAFELITKIKSEVRELLNEVNVLAEKGEPNSMFSNAIYVISRRTEPAKPIDRTREHVLKFIAKLDSMIAAEWKSK